MDVVDQNPGQVGTLLAPQGDHEGWQPQIGTEIQLLYQRLQQGCRVNYEYCEDPNMHNSSPATYSLGTFPAVRNSRCSDSCAAADQAKENWA